eukprot:gene48919-26299_t
MVLLEVAGAAVRDAHDVAVAMEDRTTVRVRFVPYSGATRPVDERRQR